MLDRIDQKIVSTLIDDGRASAETVADRVGLSPTPTRRRVRRLEETGVIAGYRADIDPDKCGLELAIYVFIKLQSRDRDSIAKFESRILALPEIQRCDLITGAHDYILTVRLPGMKDYNRYLRDILAELPGVFGIETSVVIGQVKNTPHLPLGD
ncbi:MAG: Lrp/AsnC family transcriptional regulator [Alphaproteobacteria bacterium]|nr:Lrp/AsnC family transcriptional regulator [Alphaproteobacteria bacterium]